MSDNSNNVHFSGMEFVCSPYLASLGSIMTRCGPHESYAFKMNIVVILKLKQILSILFALVYLPGYERLVELSLIALREQTSSFDSSKHDIFIKARR